MLKKILIFCFITVLYNKSFSDVNTDKIINYLSSFNTLKSNFIQVNIHLLKSKNLENRIEITFSTTKNKDDEKIHITFEKQPLIMKKWEIDRLNNNKTQIMFNNLLLDNQIDSKLFDIEREDPRIAPWKN